MADVGGLNTLQLAGLIGTTTSQIMSSTNLMSQGQLAAAQTNIEAGGILASGMLQAEQTLIESELQQLLREQQQADLMYESQRQEIQADVITAQIDLSSAQGQAKQEEILRTYNKADANTVLMAVAQGRTGATVENLRRQQRARADREIELAKSVTKIEETGLRAKQAELLAGSKVSSLAAQSSKAVSKLEQATAKSQAEFTRKSSAITAQSMREQAKIAKRVARSSAITGIGLSLATAGVGAGLIK